VTPYIGTCRIGQAILACTLIHGCLGIIAIVCFSNAYRGALKDIICNTFHDAFFINDKILHLVGAQVFDEAFAVLKGNVQYEQPGEWFGLLYGS
jgi:hypothetical protein